MKDSLCVPWLQCLVELNHCTFSLEKTEPFNHNTVCCHVEDYRVSNCPGGYAVPYQGQKLLEYHIARVLKLYWIWPFQISLIDLRPTPPARQHF